MWYRPGMDMDEYMQAMLAMARERKCLSCEEPCRNARHPDTHDYDRNLPLCRCCHDYPPDDVED